MLLNSIGNEALRHGNLNHILIVVVAIVVLLLQIGEFWEVDPTCWIYSKVRQHETN